MSTVPLHLLEKYGTNGPRYTSYPTVPHWTEEVGARPFASALRGLGEDLAAGASPDVEIYVHVPFCSRWCTFCGCTVQITRKQEPVEQYLSAIAREAMLVRDAARRRIPIRALHLGGGTPTHLTPGQLDRLLDVLEEALDFSPCEERSIEVHPTVTTTEQVETLAARGFQRMSPGVQDLNPEVQPAIHRFQTLEQTLTLVETARGLGFQSVNVDLVYGLPRQTVEGFLETVRVVTDARIDRLAVYGYAHVPWLKPNQRAIAEEHLPDPAQRRDLAHAAEQALREAGYRSIGLDHFARESDELLRAQKEATLWRSFMGYTTRRLENLIGLGPSAISEVGPLYAQNAAKVGAWAAALEAGGFATERGCARSREDLLRRDLIQSVLCHLRIPVRQVEREHGIDFDREFASILPRLEEARDDGLLEGDGQGGFRLTAVGRYLSRNVAMLFDAYLTREQESGPRYSRTV